MDFNLEHAVFFLSRTPEVLRTQLEDLPDTWTRLTEGGETWSVFDVVGHLLHGEKADWITRTKIILSNADDITFNPFDRFAQLESSKGKTLNELLHEFARLRKINLETLQSLALSEEHMDLPGIHPALGPVTLRQLLSTWVVHDLNHIAQVNRIMAVQYKDQVGPWQEYLRILKS